MTNIAHYAKPPYLRALRLGNKVADSNISTNDDSCYEREITPDRECADWGRSSPGVLNRQDSPKQQVVMAST